MDTSILVKKYIDEPGSPQVVELLESAEAVIISVVGYAEVLAAFNRRKREGTISGSVYGKIHKEFESDWETFTRVNVSKEVNVSVRKLVSVYPLRGFDAIHLASALAMRRIVKNRLLFASADARLDRAANKEGLIVYGR